MSKKNDLQTTIENQRRYVRESIYEPHHKDVLLHLLDLMHKRGMSQSEVARGIKHGARRKSVSPATVSQLLNGSYQANPEALIRSIRTFLNVQTGRDIFRDGGFVETRLFSSMQKMADIANTLKRITCVHGGIMAGKTINAEALNVRYDRAAVVFISCPRADSYGGFVKRLASILGCAKKGTISDNREAIIDTLDTDHLLIIDEFHQPAVNYSRISAVRVYNFLAEINEMCRCGILLVGDSAGWDHLKTAPGFDHISERLRAGLDITDKTNDLRPGFGRGGTDDVRKICEAFGMPEPSPTELQTCRDIISARSLSSLFDLLILARARAERLDEKLSWSHVISGHKTLQALN